MWLYAACRIGLVPFSLPVYLVVSGVRKLHDVRRGYPEDRRLKLTKLFETVALWCEGVELILMAPHPLVWRGIWDTIGGFGQIKKRRKAPIVESPDGPQQLYRLPFAIHPIEVARRVAWYSWFNGEIRFDAQLICAALLHDHVEDIAGWTFERITTRYGEQVSNYVWWISHRDKSLEDWQLSRDLYEARLLDSAVPWQALLLSLVDKLTNEHGSLFWLSHGFSYEDFSKRRQLGPNLKKLKRLYELIYHPRIYVKLPSAVRDLNALMVELGSHLTIEEVGRGAGV